VQAGRARGPEARFQSGAVATQRNAKHDGGVFLFGGTAIGFFVIRQAFCGVSLQWAAVFLMLYVLGFGGGQGGCRGV